jgi:hypothetical protein
MHLKATVFVLVISLFLAGGCATMNQSECVNAD